MDNDRMAENVFSLQLIAKIYCTAYLFVEELLVLSPIDATEHIEKAFICHFNPRRYCRNIHDVTTAPMLQVLL